MKRGLMSILLALCMVLTLLPTTAMVANSNSARINEGWYYLRCMGNYLNLDENGNAELRDKTNTAEGNTKFLVHFWGTGGYGLQTKDGRFLGVELPSTGTPLPLNSSKFNGLRIKALEGVDTNELDSNKHIFRWDIYSENNKDIWSLRPRMNKDILMNAAGQSNTDGTHVILWTHLDRGVCPASPNPDAPNHGEFRFIHADPSWVDPGGPKTPADGWYRLEVRIREWNGYSNITHHRILNIHNNGGAEIDIQTCLPGTSEFYVTNMGSNQITLKMGDGRYLGVAEDMSNGVRVKAVKTPYLWNTYSEKQDYADSDKFSLRPSTNTKMVLNVSEHKVVVGTPIILWEHTDMDAPSNAEFTFRVLTGDQIPGGAVTTPPTPPAPPLPPVTVTATPSKTSFVMNGRPVSVTAAYTINGINYLQLRALAAMLNGTAAQFDVSWDGQYAVIEPGKPFSGTVAQTKLQSTKNVKQSTTQFKLNGEVFTFKDARLIDGSTNYLQLREFAQKLTGTLSQFNVYWDATANQAVIQPGVAYTGKAP